MRITLAHGAGGKAQYDLLKNHILKYFGNEILTKLEDSAILEDIVFTTDSYTVSPVFFPGGDIGKLAISGTINDILCAGASPLYISFSIICEEGFEIENLEKILESAKKEAEFSGVKIVCGDFKVVEHGKIDSIFINTSGIGKAIYNYSPDKIKVGDKIIVTGTIGDHGIAIVCARGELGLMSDIKSDCRALIKFLDIFDENIHCVRDPTRGGLGGILAEICEGKEWGIEIWEEKIPVNGEVKSACELLGFDYIYLANEGKFVIFVDKDYADEILSKIRNLEEGKYAEIIGEVVSSHQGKVLLHTGVGGARIIDLPSGELLPRIC